MRLQVLIGNLVAAVFLYVFLRRVDFAELGQALLSAHPAALVASVLINLAGFWLRTLRWQHLLAPIRCVRPRRLFAYVMIGFGANNLVPRSGELLRPWLLGRREGIRVSAAFATIVVERVFDFLCILVAFASITLLAPVPTASEGLLTAANVRRGGLVLAACSLTGLALLLGLRRWPGPLLRGSDAILAWAPQSLRLRVRRVITAFTEGLEVLGRPRDVAYVLLYSALMWAAIIVAIHAVLLSLDLGTLPWWSSTFLVGAMALAMMIPSPGGVGTVHTVMQETLELLGAGTYTAKSVAILGHATGFFPVLLLGLYYFRREHLALADVARAAEGGAAAGAEGQGDARK